MKTITEFSSLLDYYKHCRAHGLQPEVQINGLSFWLDIVEEEGTHFVHLNGLLCALDYSLAPTGTPREGKLDWEPEDKRHAKKLQMKPIALEKLGKNSKDLQ